MVEFRKIRRFTGTRKEADSAIFLQYRVAFEKVFGPWKDVMDISRTLTIKDGHDNYAWETIKDEQSYKKAQEYEFDQAIRRYC